MLKYPSVSSEKGRQFESYPEVYSASDGGSQITVKQVIGASGRAFIGTHGKALFTPTVWNGVHFDGNRSTVEGPHPGLHGAVG